MRVLTVNGSYRRDGFTDQVLREVTRELEEFGVRVEHVVLRDQPIEFCLNCRHCTQQPGSQPGQCVHSDAMDQIVVRIERADAVVLAAPTNMGSVTALYKRFMERLIVYAYWPWGAKAPRYRKASVGNKKKALVISSSAAPSILGRPFFGSLRQLKWSAKVVGAKSVKALFFGMVADRPDPVIRTRDWMKIKQAVHRLVS